MARLFIDGFEHGDLYLWESSRHATLTPTDPLTGSYSLQIASVAGESAYIVKDVPAGTKICFGGRVLLTGTNAILYVKFLSISGGIQGIAKFGISDVDDRVSCGVYDSDFGVIGSPVNKDIYSTSFIFQVKFTNVNETDKEMQIYINSALQRDESFSNSSADSLVTGKVGLYNEEVSTKYITIDDIVIDDADMPGKDQRIYGLTPNADGSTTEWTPVSGESHYEMVDTVPVVAYGYATSEWVQSETPDAIDLMGMSALPYGDQDVKSVQVQIYGNNGNVSGETFKVAVHASGETHFGNSGEYAELFDYTTTLWDNNPATSGEWTVAEVQALEAGAVFVGA